MKKNGLYVLIGVLMISQFILLLKINKLESQSEYTKSQMNNLSNEIRNNINAIYSNVDDMLNKKESLIEISATEVGTVNRDNLTVPITFTLTPKEVSANTTVNLNFNGELFQMDKMGTSSDYEISKKIPLGEGEVSTMIVIATDSLGLEHHYTIDTWIGGSNRQRESWFEDEYIYSPDGKLLWKPDYQKHY